MSTMLAYPRRQHIPSAPTQNNPFFLDVPHTTATPSPSDFNAYNQNRSYFDCNQSTSPINPSNTVGAHQSMPRFDFSNPAIRIQQFSPPIEQSIYSSESLPTAGQYSQTIGNQVWPPYTRRRSMNHRRAPSSSSVASSSPASPYNRSHLANTKAEQSPVSGHMNADGSRRVLSNLPTPSDTPTSETFTANGPLNSNNNQNYVDTMTAHYAMKDMLMGGQEATPDTPNFSHSSRHSVSSYNDHEAPTTPRTVSGDEYDYKTANLQELQKPHPIIPKFSRTITDIYQDELFNPVAINVTPAPVQPERSSNPSLLCPYPTSSKLQERLQAANRARSGSPGASGNDRATSPYRQSSAYAQSSDDVSARPSSAARLREQEKAAADAAALKSHIKQESEEPPKSISPKETMLEYHETEADAKMPLFSEEQANEYEAHYGGGDDSRLVQNATTGNYNNLQSAQSYNSNLSGDWAIPQQPSSSYAHTNSINSQHTYNNYAQQSMQVSAGMHGLPFSSQNYRNITNMPAHEESPEFPAHLTSMESSVSEAAPTSSQNSITQQEPLQKPASSLADTGTYSCTYHGCTLRFATPQKLQKHKREAHRSAAATTTPSSVGSGMTSAQLLARNSQAGPHRCDRINPTTGKPCNTVFSRPYDLTRHEDTIHNARKQKVRCALCVEEKTFSRNDALTRHMRVVHPEVDFPGKHRRRGAASD